MREPGPPGRSVLVGPRLYMNRRHDARQWRRWVHRRLWISRDGFTAALTLREAAALAHVTPRTVSLWLDERGGTPPPSARELLEFKALGVFADPKWRGWAVRRGRLVAPFGQAFTPAEIAAWGEVYHRADVFWAEILQLRAEVERLEGKLAAVQLRPQRKH